MYGILVLSFALKHFDDLFNYNFTSQMEKRLDKVAEGNENWKQVLRDMWDSYKDRYTELSSKQDIKIKDNNENKEVLDNNCIKIPPKLVHF